MTRRAIIVLALAATALLAVGARLLEQPSVGIFIAGATCLVVGLATAGAAVAGAWRTAQSEQPEPSQQAESVWDR